MIIAKKFSQPPTLGNILSISNFGQDSSNRIQYMITRSINYSITFVLILSTTHHKLWDYMRAFLEGRESKYLIIILAWLNWFNQCLFMSSLRLCHLKLSIILNLHRQIIHTDQRFGQCLKTKCISQLRLEASYSAAARALSLVLTTSSFSFPQAINWKNRITCFWLTWNPSGDNSYPVQR